MEYFKSRSLKNPRYSELHCKLCINSSLSQLAWRWCRYHKSCRTISSLGHGGNLSALSFMCFASVASAQILDFSISYFCGDRELETIRLYFRKVFGLFCCLTKVMVVGSVVGFRAIQKFGIEHQACGIPYMWSLGFWGLGMFFFGRTLVEVYVQMPDHSNRLVEARKDLDMTCQACTNKCCHFFSSETREKTLQDKPGKQRKKKQIL